MENELKLSQKIYSISNITYCADQYRELCNIVISDRSGYYYCYFTDCKYGVTETINEFENYLIGYTYLKVHKVHSDDNN